MFWRLFAFLCLVLPAQAQPPDVTWAPLAGPHGGNVQALAALPGVAVASDWERLYRSENGRRWTRVDVGSAGFRTSDLFSATDAIYAHGATQTPGARLLRSSDGHVWRDAGAGLPATGIQALAEAPGGTLYATTASGLFRRRATDTVWQPTAFTAPSYGLAIGPGGTILLGAPAPPVSPFERGSDFAVWRSTDEAATWRPVPLEGGAGAVVAALTFLADGSVLAGGVGVAMYPRAGFYRSTDDGRTWTRVRDNVFAERFSVVPGGRVYAGHPWNSHHSDDGGLTWTPFEYGGMGVVVGPGGGLLASTGHLGIVRSDDGGATWTDATEGFGRAEVGHVTVAPDGTIYAAQPENGWATGLHRSTDRGLTWTRHAMPFEYSGLHDLIADGAGRVFAAPQRCCGGGPGGGLFRSDDGGVSWRDVTPGVRSGYLRTQVKQLVRQRGRLWVLADSLYASDDGGLMWRGRPLRAVTFTIGPDGTFWATGGHNVVRSTNEGTSWQIVGTFPSVVRLNAVGPLRSGAVVLSAYEDDFRSPDGGATWVPLDFSLGARHQEVRTFFQAPDGVVYAAVDGPPPLMRSLDDGVTWVPASTGLPGTDAYYADLAVDPSGRLLLALGRQGLYQTTGVVVAASPALISPAALVIRVAPNPARGVTTVALTLPASVRALDVSVFDVTGRRVARLHEGAAAGTLSLRFDGAGLPAGLYHVRAQAAGARAMAPLVLVR